MTRDEYDIDERTAEYMKKTIAEFAGMTVEEIQEFVTRNTNREHNQWVRERNTKLERERKEDEWVLKDEKQPKIDPKAWVETEDCIRITPQQIQDGGFVTKREAFGGEEFVKLSVGGKKIFVSKSLVSRALSARKFFSHWG